MGLGRLVSFYFWGEGPCCVMLTKKIEEEMKRMLAMLMVFAYNRDKFALY